MPVPFTVDDFQDLLRLLDQHPEWRAELRRHVLSDELLELPALMRQLAERVDRLAEAQARTADQLTTLTARVDALAERADALTARVDALAEAQARTAEQLTTLTARVDALAEALTELATRVDSLADRVGSLSGKMLESQYRERAGAYFSPLARRLQVVDPGRLADRLDDAVEAGQLTASERTDVLQADIVLAGVRREDRAEIYLVVEVSTGIGPYDVERAAQRARLLAKLGQPVLPVVAGEWIARETEAQARAAGVWQMLDGHTVPPAPAASA
jgi:uncharacterized protein YoxC